MAGKAWQVLLDQTALLVLQELLGLQGLMVSKEILEPLGLLVSLAPQAALADRVIQVLLVIAVIKVILEPLD
jgi:hypothetical protein